MGPTEFEIPILYPSRNVQVIFGKMHVKLRREVEAGKENMSIREA